MVEFLGRLHVVVLHVPIGVLVALALVELHAFWRSAPTPASSWTLALFAALSAVATAVFGIFLSWSGSYEPALLFRHKWYGITVAALSLVVFGLRAREKSGHEYRAALVLTLMMTVLAGHQGGSLTHGSGFLLDTATASEVVDASPAVRLLETHCHECHGSSQQESGLRLDDRSAILAGGESGRPAVVPGDAMTSELVRRITLPRGDDDAMPPDGRERLSPDDVLVLIDWIHAGAPFGTAVGIEAAPPELVEAIAAAGIDIEPLSEDDPRLSVSFQFAPGDAGLTLLAPVATQIAWLDVKGATFTDTEWDELGSFEHLERLHLEQSNVDDNHLALLARAARLEYINVYDTRVSDAGLAHLSGLPALRDVYVWQSRVSDEGMARFVEENPAVRVHGAAVPGR